MIRAISYLALILLLSCNGKTVFRGESSKIDALCVNFINKFNIKKLPCDIIPSLDTTLDFKNKIDFESVNSRLSFDNDKKDIVDPLGGYYNFYYSNRYLTTDSFYLISYYRVSQSGYDYIIATLNKYCKLIDQLIIAGQVDDQSQMEAIIDKNMFIESTNIKILGRLDNGIFSAQKIKYYYKLLHSGHFRLVTMDSTGISKYKFAEHTNRLTELH